MEDGQPENMTPLPTLLGDTGIRIFLHRAVEQFIF